VDTADVALGSTSAIAGRASKAGVLTITVRHATRTRRSLAAFNAISGPIPAGSPVAMAMRGFTGLSA
jgi:hypothetical protein